MSQIDQESAMVAWRDRADEAAAMRLVHECSPLMRGIALKLLRCSDLAEEAVQISWIKVFRSSVSFDFRIPIASWTALITRNVCLNYQRDLMRRRAVLPLACDLDEAMLLNARDGTPPQDLAMTTSDEIHTMRHAIAALREKDRLILELLYLEKKSVAEVERRTGLKHGAARVQAHRIRKKLRMMVESAYRESCLGTQRTTRGSIPAPPCRSR